MAKKKVDRTGGYSFKLRSAPKEEPADIPQFLDEGSKAAPVVAPEPIVQQPEVEQIAPVVQQPEVPVVAESQRPSVVAPRVKKVEVVEEEDPRSTGVVVRDIEKSERLTLRLDIGTCNKLRDLIRVMENKTDGVEVRKSELLKALILGAYESRDEIEPRRLGKRGAWGSSTAAVFVSRMKTDIARAIAKTFSAQD